MRLTGSHAEKLLRVVSGDFHFGRGAPLPLGATVLRGGVNFAVVSKHATSVTLLIFLPGEEDSVLEFPFDLRFNRTGDVWHAFIDGLDPGVHYAYRMDRAPNPAPQLHRFAPRDMLLDPYAKAVAGGETWGVRARQRRCLIVGDGGFDWGSDQPLNIPLAASVIYELHVRGFTRHPSSGVSRPGTFAGLAEKIPYLKTLGVTAVELLPVAEFEEADSDRVNPFTGERLLNYWGYHPISFFAPNAAYAAPGEEGAQLREFKEMVRSFHEAGIEVILDVVFNHTAEGDERGPTYSLRGIDNSIYYMIDRWTGAYLNYSGCGNTVNCNHPLVRDLICDALRYWVTELHVDGFRFDLASILGRAQDGSVLANPPLLEHLAHDPVLAETKLIAEAWDAGGLYQVGTFPAWGRWAEWNGRYRDDLRRFVKGDPGMVRALATRLVGSPDLYQTSGRYPYHSINFVTCHDGFTLADLVAYNEKHNEANGEGNADGANDNHSWNCGREGPTDDPSVNGLRRRQARNLATLLLLAHGVPMILAGDELGRTQGGNNNAYCQDNEVSWVDWNLLEENAELFRFFRLLIRFRREHGPMHRAPFAPHRPELVPGIQWHGVELGRPDWSWESRALAVHHHGARDGREDHVYLITNAHWEAHAFALPPLPGFRWFRFVDTSLEPPREITEIGMEEPLLDQGRYLVGPRSVVVLVGK